MGIRISVGGEDFNSVRASGSYYVDKTELLYNLVHDTDNKVTLFTRPRRFGKTLNISMIGSFFDITRAGDSTAFNGLSIMNHKDFCDACMHRFPVLSLSFKDVEGLDFETAFQKLKAVIADLCKTLVFLEQDETTDPDDRAIFARLKSKSENSEEVQNSLKTIMRMMTARYKKPVILLIDEYDVPLAKAYENGYYREMLDVIRGIMSISLKTNDYLNFAVITGCLRIPKESVFTGVNNFASYSVMSEDFSQYFGFTEEEVLEMLKTFDLSNKADLIREWYDGYVFGRRKLYCPWDVVNYVSALLKRKNAHPENYWENTSGNNALRRFFELPGIDVSGKFEALLNGKSISESVTDSLTYDTVYASEHNLWSILLMTGYVTLADSNALDFETGTAALKIPNKEIAGIFQEAVVERFKKTLNRTDISRLMDALWNKDTKNASEIVSDLLWHTISYMDYSEDYYHAFLTGLFTGLGYEVQSNKERGLCRPDIVVKDRFGRRAIVIEAKRSRSAETMEQDCEKALRQLKDNQYAENFDGYRQINSFGIAFFRKTAMVKAG